MGLVSALLLLSAGVTAPGFEGWWLTDDRKGIVRIRRCGEQLCGHIAQVLDTGPNVPKTDIMNPDARRRSRPILGLPVLWGLTGSGGVWKGGRAYDPKSGRSYRASLELNPDGSLKLTGCVLFICQSRRWTRVR